MSEFQKLLQQAKSNAPAQAIAKPNSKPDLTTLKQKLSQLPSQIILPKPAAIKSPTIIAKKSHPSTTRNHSNQPIAKTRKVIKTPSFKQLMKIAKQSKPEGLITVNKVVDPSSKKEQKKPLPNHSSPIFAKVVPVISTPQPAKLPYTNRKTGSKIVYNKSRKNMPTDFVKLNVKKRDLATIEDILEEKRLRKGEPSAKDTSTKVITQSRISTSTKPDLSRRTNVGENARINSHNLKRKESYRSDSEPRKRANNYSSIISQMFGYDRSRYNNESSDDDMEVGFNDLAREEKRRYFCLTQFENW